MIAVMFEAMPSVDGRAEYLERAAQLAPVLAGVDGFISVERFASLTTPGKMLSLSFWRDEAAMQTWREQEQHRAAQRAGRDGVFDDYRLRVASVIRDYGMNDRAQAPVQSPAQSVARSLAQKIAPPANTGAQSGAPVGTSTGTSTGTSVGASAGASADVSAGASSGAQSCASIGTSAGASVGASADASARP